MLHTNMAVIVEGKYDKIKLSSIIDAVIIPTNGFGVFRDKEKNVTYKVLCFQYGNNNHDRFGYCGIQDPQSYQRFSRKCKGR